MKCLTAKTEKKGTVTITVKSGKNQSKSYKIISNDEKKPSTVNVGGFFVERKIRWKHFVVVLNPDPPHILCVREVRTIRAEQVQNLFAGNIRKLLLEAAQNYDRRKA